MTLTTLYEFRRPQRLGGNARPVFPASLTMRWLWLESRGSGTELAILWISEQAIGRRWIISSTTSISRFSRRLGETGIDVMARMSTFEEA
jgi:hypothetical protein